MNNQYQNPTYQTDPSSGMNPDLVATQVAIQHLINGKGWVRFVSVLGFIAFAFMLLGTLGMLAGVSRAGGFGLIMFLLMAALSAVVLILSIRMTKYANAIGRITFTSNPLDLEDAMTQQMNFWRLYGILVCIFCVFGIIGLIQGGSAMGRF